MALTQQQLTTLKAAILADPVLSAQPMTSGGAFAIAEALNLPASPTVTLWRTDAPTTGIIDAILWDRYTPNDAADGTTLWLNRILASQTKQMNLQLMLQGRATLDCSKANIRAGLRDATTAVPTGANGAANNPGGANGSTVLNACTRPALRIEAILVGADATTGATTAKLIGYEGRVTSEDVQQARELP